MFELIFDLLVAAWNNLAESGGVGLAVVAPLGYRPLGMTFRAQQNMINMALQSQRRHEANLARIRAGVQPNRTPSQGLLDRLQQPIPGSPGANPAPDLEPLPPPPGTGGTPIPRQGSSIPRRTAPAAPPVVVGAAPNQIKATAQLRQFLTGSGERRKRKRSG